MSRRAPREAGAGEAATRRGDSAAAIAGGERRRASRFLWAACESLLAAAAEPRSMNRALDMLLEAFECDGVALYGIAATGALELWSARGAWKSARGDLRDCLSVPLLRGSERVGSIDLRARTGASWRPAQLAMIRTAAGALGAALGARLELQRLRHQAGRDPLTGLPDLKAFRERLVDELARARRHALPVGIVLFDVDHLAAINERYGRAAGDMVLAECALKLKLTLRESDIVARHTGGTFAILLPETDRASSLRCADRVRRALEEHRFARVGRVSASAGVAACPPDGMEAVELIDSAERALALAKKGGRRRVMAPAPGQVH